MSDETDLKIEKLKVEIEAKRAEIEQHRACVEHNVAGLALSKQDTQERSEVRQADHATYTKEKEECSQKRQADEKRNQELHAANMDYLKRQEDHYPKLYARWEKDDVDRDARNKINDQFCQDQRNQLKRMADELERLAQFYIKNK